MGAAFFSAVLATLAPARAETVARTAPVGWLVRDLPVGTAGLACPLIKTEVFAGKLTTNSGSLLTLSNAQARPGATLTAGNRYYVEIADGPFEGERLELNTAATIASANATLTVDLSANSGSTLASLGANQLAQARCVVRPHVTLAGLAATFSPSLVGNNNYNLADSVKVFGPSGFVTYYLRGDGQSWRTVGGTADLRQLVLAPDASVLVVLRSGAKRWLQSGTVRTNVFRQNLPAGTKSFASGFPRPMSFIGISGFIDSSAPAGQRWKGSDTPTQADQVLVFNAATGAYNAYYLRANGVSWRAVSGGTDDLAGDLLLDPAALVLVQRQNADGSYLIVRPFTP